MTTRDEILAHANLSEDEQRQVREALNSHPRVFVERRTPGPCETHMEIIIELRAELAALRVEREQLQNEIAIAREACPTVRMQDYFDAPLLTLIEREVSRGFNRDALIVKLQAELQREREIGAARTRMLHQKADELRAEWIRAENAEAQLPKEPSPHG